jgi:hypothetical protein
MRSRSQSAVYVRKPFTVGTPCCRAGPSNATQTAGCAAPRHLTELRLLEIIAWTLGCQAEACEHSLGRIVTTNPPTCGSSHKPWPETSRSERSRAPPSKVRSQLRSHPMVPPCSRYTSSLACRPAQPGPPTRFPDLARPVTRSDHRIHLPMPDPLSRERTGYPILARFDWCGQSGGQSLGR